MILYSSCYTSIDIIYQTNHKYGSIEQNLIYNQDLKKYSKIIKLMQLIYIYKVKTKYSSLNLDNIQPESNSSREENEIQIDYIL